MLLFPTFFINFAEINNNKELTTLTAKIKFKVYLVVKLSVGLIGFGRMGRCYLEALQRDSRYNVTYICDPVAECRTLAKSLVPEATVCDSEEVVLSASDVQVVIVCALADVRPEQIGRALAAGKHVIAEKPLADSVEREWQVVAQAEEAERRGVFSTVNMYLLNSWYFHEMQRIVDSGEIGELAIMRICHMTPGLAPGEGHEAEGPAFHDCGMHYVGLGRFLSRSEYKTWHAQGVRMWSWKDPWWVQVHGTMENGVVFDITQGFVYGQMSKDQTHNSYVELIGTLGFCHMTHDFKTAVLDLRGVNTTERIERPHGGKNIEVLLDQMAESIAAGQHHADMPRLRDSAIASEYAWRMVDDARSHDLPAIGTLDELERIRERRRHMTDGYGLLPKNREKN